MHGGSCSLAQRKHECSPPPPFCILQDSVAQQLAQGSLPVLLSRQVARLTDDSMPLGGRLSSAVAAPTGPTLADLGFTPTAASLSGIDFVNMPFDASGLAGLVGEDGAKSLTGALGGETRPEPLHAVPCSSLHAMRHARC